MDTFDESIADLVRTQMSNLNPEVPFLAGETAIRLSVPTYGVEEVVEAIDSLVSTWVTMGKKVKSFEQMFSQYLGSRHSVMVNSGSSANLLALSMLMNPSLAKPIRPGDEIITPAVTWATTVFPILNVGAIPVLVDVDAETFNIDPQSVIKAITPRTRAILPVHLLGNPCDMDQLTKIARENDLYLLEDACEAHGAEYNGQKVGTFGDVSTFSFFFSHHISTIEGGMVVTNDDELAELAKALRVFGWIRDQDNRDELAQQNEEIDPRFLFTNTGFNLRPSEIQGAFGIHQLPRLDSFIEHRRSNADYWTEQLGEFAGELQLPFERPGTRHVWFGYPITVKPTASFTRGELVRHLESRGLETRPIMAGNIAEQPAMQLFEHQVGDSLANSERIHRQSFFFGNHQGIQEEQKEAIVGYFKEFFAGVR